MKSEDKGFQGGFRQSMAWLHTWTGLCVCWLLFAIFLTGTLSFYRDEINVWMKPELHGSQADEQTAQRALDRMALLAPKATNWSIGLPNEREPAVSVSWREPGAAQGRAGAKRAMLDAGTGEVVEARETRGGDFLYRFHFELYGFDRLAARMLVGAATMIMLVGLVTGVVTHKKIFKDFFTFRPRKGQRSWLDAHNATAVLALPFHLMITYSGLLLLMYSLMPWGMQAAYPDGRDGFFAELRGGGRPAENAQANREGGGREGGRGGRREAEQEVAVALTPIAPLLAQASARWGGMPVGNINVERPGTARAVIELRALHGDSLVDRGAVDTMKFDGVTGAPLTPADPRTVSATRGFYNSLSSLHMIHFAGPVLRMLFFVAGLIGTAMVATGAVLWVVKRAPERLKLGHTPRGHRLVEMLNVAAIAGLPLAVGAYFWANRLIPADMVTRSDWEIRSFFIVWALTLVHAVLRPHARAWIEQLLLAAALLVLAPVLNAATSDSHLFASLLAGRWSLVGVEVVQIATGAGLGYIAWRVARFKPPQKASRRSAASSSKAVESRSRLATTAESAS